MTLPLIFDLSKNDIASLLKKWGEPSFRLQQIWQGLYKHHYSSANQFTNIPLQLRRKIVQAAHFCAFIKAASTVSRDNKTTKTLLTLNDGHAIEAVWMRYTKRDTLCISTQVGCAMNCSFCATGQMGFKRHLTSGEIIAQVMYFAQILNSEGRRVTNIVVMGMGEPFHNYDNTMAAVAQLRDPSGYDFSARRITISTVGIVPNIERFSEENNQINLAISLHASDNETRSKLVPINDKYPLEILMDACRAYTKITKRRLTFEWALIRDVNDTQAQANQLIHLLRGLLCHVNVIQLNPTRHYSGQRSTRQRANEFKNTLEQAGIPCTIRLRRGIEINAGCGQLAVHNE